MTGKIGARGTVAERMTARTDISGGPDACWLWTAGKNDQGYGVIHAAGRHQYAHRLAYEAARSPIPAGMQIDHLCRTRACVNPRHLAVVTQRENIRRSGAPSSIGTRTGVCIRGHRLDEAGSDGRRGQCRLCANASREAGRRRRTVVHAFELEVGFPEPAEAVPSA